MWQRGKKYSILFTTRSGVCCNFDDLCYGRHDKGSGPKFSKLKNYCGSRWIRIRIPRHTLTVSKNPCTSSLGEQYKSNSFFLILSVQEVHKSGRGKVQQVPCELLLQTIKKGDLFLNTSIVNSKSVQSATNYLPVPAETKHATNIQRLGKRA